MKGILFIQKGFREKTTGPQYTVQCQWNSRLSTITYYATLPIIKTKKKS
uniref:Uncharacterized protein n=1 Tax=Anguilla anguilla TaxID=7936 RepID=A0A0E9TUQ0_ANGAN